MVFFRVPLPVISLAWGKKVAATLTVLVYSVTSHLSWLQFIVVVYIVFEISFYVLEWFRFIHIDRTPNVPPDRVRMLAAMQNFQTEIPDSVISIDEFLSGWFHGAKVSDIPIENMKEFVSYGFYCRKPEELTQDERQQVDYFLKETAARWNMAFKRGYDETLSFKGHTLEPLRALHKPLIFYFFMEILAIFCHLVLLAWGFRRNRTVNQDSRDTVTTWTKQRRSGREPIVFLHGVGLGILPYLHFIRSLLHSCKDRTIIVVEMPHVSLRTSIEAPCLDILADDITKSVHGKATFIAHSYGTFVVSKMLHKYPDLVGSVVLLDPVTLLTCHPTLLSNFVYIKLPKRFPRSRNDIMQIIQFICMRDLTLSQTFCRKFNGMEVMLWPMDMPKGRKHIIVVSGRDKLLPAEGIRKQFQPCIDSGQVELLYHEKLEHGGLLFDRKWMQTIVKSIEQLCRDDTF